MTDDESNSFSEDIAKVMDIAREMSQEEIKEALERNPLYKFLMEIGSTGERKWHIKKK